jgi:N-glycosylase/DNA lyase
VKWLWSSKNRKIAVSEAVIFEYMIMKEEHLWWMYFDKVDGRKSSAVLHFSPTHVTACNFVKQTREIQLLVKHRATRAMSL